MRHVKEELEKEFIMPIKSNRKVALSLEDKKDGKCEQAGSLKLKPNMVVEVTSNKYPSRCYFTGEYSKTRMAVKVFCIWSVAT